MENIRAVAPVQGAPLPSNETNAFMIIMMAMLGGIDAHQDAINLGIAKEKLLKASFDEQKQAVKDQEEVLQKLVNESANDDPSNVQKIQEDLRAVSAQMSRVQMEETKLSNVQNQMVQEMKRRIDPSQKMIENDTVMFGGMLNSYIRTERT